NGAISGSLPQCSPVACTYNLPSAAGVQHNCTNVTTGSTCLATCTTGGFEYASGGATEFTCRPSGAFSGLNPTCARIPCADLVLADHFNHGCRNKFFQDTCAVTCAAGFTLVGSASQYQCSASGVIQGTEPSCVPKTCDNNIPDDFLSDCGGITTGAACTVRCKPGMVPNSAQMSCHATGALLGTLPVCVPDACPSSTLLQNGVGLAHNCEDVVLLTASMAATNSKFNDIAMQCPVGLNPSEMLVDNCTGLRMGYVESNSSIATYSCSVELTMVGGSQLQCQPVSCMTDIQIPNMEHSCEGVTAGRSCFAYCKEGYAAAEGGVFQWTCSGPESNQSNVSLPVDGYALRGTIPVCLPQVCQYNIPVAAEYSHSCQNITTGQECTVECSEGWTGGQAVLSCGANGILSGALPTCSTATTTATTTTFWDGTVRLSGSLSLRLEQRRRLQAVQTELSVVQDFVEDGNVTAGLAAALATMLNASVDLTLSVASDNSSNSSGTAYLQYATGMFSDSWG
ncbi:SELE, partial [Symbiodinium pilosum]